MANVQRLIFIFLALFTSTDLLADYTPPLKYKSTGAYGTSYHADKNAVCLHAMPIYGATSYPNETLTGINTCTDNTGQTGANTTSAWYSISATYKRSSGFNTGTITAGIVIQECDSPNTRKSGAVPNVICNGTEPPPPNPCPSGEGNMNGALYSGTCINGCTKWTLGPPIYAKLYPSTTTKAYLPLGTNTGATCSTSGTSLDGDFASSKDAQAAADAAAKAAADAAAKAAADAKTAADKAAAAAAAEAAAAAKQAADDAIKKAQDSAAAAAAAAADAAATQQQKDAAAAAAASDAAAAAAAKAAAAAAAGQAAAAAKDDAQPEQKDFCEQNPKSFICKNSSITTGTCYNGKPNGFNCDSDAVLCAIAENQVESFCFNTQQDNALIDSYNDMKSDNGISSPAHSSNITTINLPTSLDASSNYAAQCNPDLTVSFNGDSVTLPFSQWCGILEALGYLFLASAYISAAYIIGGKA